MTNKNPMVEFVLRYGQESVLVNVREILTVKEALSGGIPNGSNITLTSGVKVEVDELFDTVERYIDQYWEQ